MKRYRTREVRQALVGKGSLHTLLTEQISDWDPYQPGIRIKLKSAYETAALNAWRNAKILLPTKNSIEVLENTWASVAHLGYLRKFIEIGVIMENDRPTVKRLFNLKNSIKNDTKEDIDLFSLLFETPDQTTPDLLSLDGFTDEIRIRWSLASKVQQEKSHLDLLKSAGFIKTYDSQKAFELLIEAIKNTPAKSKKISWKQTLLLSDKEYELITIDPFLAKIFLKEFKRDYSTNITIFAELRKKFKSDYELIKDSVVYLAARDWKRAAEKVSSINTDEVSKLAAKSILSISGPLEKLIDVETKNLWSPMGEAGYKNLLEIFGPKTISYLYCLNTDEIAELLIEHKISQNELQINDVAQLNLSWSAHTKNRLISASQYKIVNGDNSFWSSFSLKTLALAASAKEQQGIQLLQVLVSEYDNPKAILEAISYTQSKQICLQLKKIIEDRIILNNWRKKKKHASWISFLSNQIGTDLWIELVNKKLIDTAKFEDICLALSKNSGNIKLKLFEEQALAALKGIKKPSYENAVGIMDWIRKSPDSIDSILENLKDHHFKLITKIKINDCSFFSIKQLYLRVPEKYKFEFWKMLMNHVTDADDLISFGIDGAEKEFTTDWNPRWYQITGTSNKRLQALCLMACRDVVRLRYIASRTDHQLMAESIIWAVNNTPKITLYDRISLELSATLGLRHLSTIRWLLSQRDPRKLPGTKFDHLYTKFEIPKKSGKTRLISAPTEGLKRLQKSILLKLLNPIGAHESAFGFLPNKSIIDNASPHVGRQIVINIDIKNCFPNVAWQLVLSALKRDLSTQLSDKSISFLVDICTSSGSLPIGSPASPALLNRVLVNTDKILTQQAYLKNCTYTRYADDLTFSGDEKTLQLIGIAKSVLSRIGLQIDPVKTNIFRSGRRQICTGLVVNDKVSVPRNIRRRIRAAIHSLENEKKLHWNGDQMSTSSLRGRIEFVKMVSPETGSALAERYKIALTRSTTAKKPSSRK